MNFSDGSIIQSILQLNRRSATKKLSRVSPSNPVRLGPGLGYLAPYTGQAKTEPECQKTTQDRRCFMKFILIYGSQPCLASKKFATPTNLLVCAQYLCTAPPDYLLLELVGPLCQQSSGSISIRTHTGREIDTYTTIYWQDNACYPFGFLTTQEKDSCSLQLKKALISNELLLMFDSPYPTSQPVPSCLRRF